MKNILAIARREIGAYFATPVGWVSMGAFVLITGIFFVIILGMYNMQAADAMMNPYGGSDMDLNTYVVAPFFGNFAVIMLFVCPALTMRLLAEDTKSRAIELLLTSPVSTTEIVLGKYLGAMGFLSLVLLCTAHYPAVFFWLGTPDPGIVGASYLSVLLLGGAFMAVGLATSAFTENQVISFVTAFLVLLGLWICGWGEELASGTLKEVLSFASLINRMEEMSKGLVHTQDLVYFVSFIAFFLFVTHQRVEAYRWR